MVNTKSSKSKSQTRAKSSPSAQTRTKSPAKSKSPTKQTKRTKPHSRLKTVNSTKVHRSKSRTFFLRPRTLAQKTVLTVIILAILSVLAALCYSLLFKPESQVKSQISALSSDYYESYLYPQIAQNSADLTATLDKYAKTGFSRVSLLTLMSRDSTPSTTNFDLLLEYCDTDTTTVTFYPVAPYSSTSYRTEVNYSCSF